MKHLVTLVLAVIAGAIGWLAHGAYDSRRFSAEATCTLAELPGSTVIVCLPPKSTVQP